MSSGWDLPNEGETVSIDKNADEFLNKLDAIVGPPEHETQEEREERAAMIERDRMARRIRKAATGS